MPATLKSVTSKVNDLDVEIDGDPKGITIQYTTRKLTPRLSKEITKAVAESDEDSVVEQFLIMVTTWNFAPDAGKPPLPLTKDSLQDVPLEILGAILDAIMSDLSPKEETAT